MGSNHLNHPFFLSWVRKMVKPLSPEEIDAMISELTQLWHKAESECFNKHSPLSQKQRWLDYGHVDMVWLCDECWEKTAKEHNRIVAQKYGQ